ncbi:MAG: hypothetical protein M3256_20450 [Actinomycetota bacterium]|nr:hypothetical protein [Actinomycetota bacterium]
MRVVFVERTSSRASESGGLASACELALRLVGGDQLLGMLGEAAMTIGTAAGRA